MTTAGPNLHARARRAQQKQLVYFGAFGLPRLQNMGVFLLKTQK
jgi:hypothetical protein